jgi:uracil-DNA glycosylase family 4
MIRTLKDKLIQALTDQKEIFGDDLFDRTINMRKSVLKKNIFKGEREEISLFEDPKADWEKAQNLQELNDLIKDCTKCPLHKSRNRFGPGAEEDKQGEPFVGRAGKLLNDILKAINFEREEVYIANIVKSRPPGNRTPTIEEMDTCFPYLNKQIELIKPKLILALGLTAAQALLKKRDSLTKMRGNVYDYKGIKTMVTYHPAALLRNPHWKRGCWEDVQKFRKLYDEME